VGLLTLTATQSGMDRYYKRTKKGVALVEVDRQTHFVPPVGMKARFELSGISEPFELPNKFSDDPDATKPMIRLEFTVVKGGDNVSKMQQGKSFSALYGYSLGEKANLAKLIAAIRGEGIAKGEAVNLEEFIGCTFVSKTLGQVADKTKFSRISDEALDADTVTWPEGAAIAAEQDASEDEDQSDPNADPFEDDEDELL
jgi:hypothetical protein